MEITWSQRERIWLISESEISVPIDISAAALTVASGSSGRMEAKSVVEAFVLMLIGVRQIVDDYLRKLWEMPTVPFLPTPSNSKRE